MKKWYCDNAATTAVSPGVFRSMLPYYREQYGNPSSMYGLSDGPREAVANARRQVANLIHCEPSEVYFTAGGSESDNWALKGAYFAKRLKGTLIKEDNQINRRYPRDYRMQDMHMITTKTEHHAILHAAKFLEQMGVDVTYLRVNEWGQISLYELERAMRPNTFLISVMFANNEIGTIAPVTQIGAIAHKHGVLFHTDAVQALGQVPIDVKAMNIDLLSASSHKLHGPKGCGMLYIRDGIELVNLIHGGGQEQGLRGGTEYVPGIVGFGTACMEAANIQEIQAEKLRSLRNYMIDEILKQIPYTRINGDLENRLPGNVSVAFQYVDGSTLLSRLDMEGIFASAGSACNASNPKASHVLTAIGLPEVLARSTIRFTLSPNMSMRDIDAIVNVLKRIVMDLRRENR